MSARCQVELLGKREIERGKRERERERERDTCEALSDVTKRL